MRILFIASRLPYRPLQGDRVRGYHFLRILSRRHSITLVASLSRQLDGETRQALGTLCHRSVLVRLPQWQAVAHLLRFPFCALPLQTLYYCLPAMSRQVRRLLQNHAFDLVHVQLARMAPVAHALDSVPRILDFIDALSLNMRRRASRERWPLDRFFCAEAGRLQRYERVLMTQYDRLIVSSPLDAQALGKYENLHVVPNGVDIDAHCFTEDGRRSGMIVFTGRMAYFPNADAATWLATQVFPVVRRRVPQAEFFIVGADPTRGVRQLARAPGVHVTGYVPSIQDYLARATIAVAPMQAGSGMQLKVLEAMACGAPIVATPYALGGIEADEGEHLLVAQDPEAFAEKVVCLLKDGALGRRLARNARRLVEERYTWERSVEMLEKVYSLATGQRSRCAGDGGSRPSADQG